MATALIVAIPGPTVMLVVSHALAHGSLRAMGTVSAIAVADIILIVLSYLGVATLLETSVAGFYALKISGAGYLVYLGFRMFQAGGAGAIPSQSAATAFGLAREGFIATLLNPKSFIFVISFFPQFIQPSQPALFQIVVLTVVFLVVAILVIGVYVLLAGYVGRKLRRGSWATVINRVAGGVLIATGFAAVLIDVI